jgi:DNA polymerase I
MPKPLTYGDCENCKLQSCDGPIAWSGPIRAPVVVIGMGPGEAEILYGAPFVGPSGQMLDETLQQVGFDPGNVLRYNATQCRSMKDDDIGIKAIRCCQPNLDAVLNYAPRKLIICLGNEAWTAVHRLTKIGGARVGCGRIARVDHLSTDDHTCWSVWGVHPAFVMRSPAWKPEFVTAFERAYRIFSVGEPERPDAVIHSVNDTLDNYIALIEAAGASGEVVIDIETNNKISKASSPNYQTDDVLGIGVAWAVNGKPHAFYIPLQHGDPLTTVEWDDSEFRYMMNALREFIFCDDVSIVAQNGKFDARFLKYQYGLDMHVDYDTMIAHRMLDENKPHSLKFMARHWINCPDWDIIDKLPDGGRLGSMPLEEVAEYCCWDCVYTLLLKDLFDEQLDGQPFEHTLKDLDFPLFRELTEIELRGVNVDQEVLALADEALVDEMVVAAQEVDEASGWAGKPLPHNDKRKKNGELSAQARIGVNPSSSKDVGFLLYDYFKCPVPTRGKLLTKSGEARTNKETIDWMMGVLNQDHPAIPFIESMERYRSLKTLYGNVIKGTRESLYPDGKLHTNYGFNPKTDDLSAPVTGRLSSSGPNMQNWKKAFRPIIVAPDGYVIMEADYSQLEVRVWAYHSQDEKLLDAIISGDYHRRTASVALGKPESEITEAERAMSKVLTFGGVMYGGSTSVVCRMLKCPESEAKELLDGMFAEFHVGKEWLDSQVEHALKYGWVETLFHRRRRIPEIRSSNEHLAGEAQRQAMNSPIQGGAAEITNYAIIRLAERFRNELNGAAYIVNTVHDSIIDVCPEESAEQVKPMMIETMGQKPLPDFNVPLDVEVTVSKRWGGEPDYSKMRMAKDE